MIISSYYFSIITAVKSYPITIKFIRLVYIEYILFEAKYPVEMLKTLMKNTNIFAFENFWKANGNMSYSSACGGIVSLPLLVIIFTLIILEMI